MLPAQPNQSLIDGIACLQALTAQGQPVGVRAMARELGMEPTRVNRLIKTLAHLGLAQQTPDRKYQVGPAIHVLSAQVLYASGLIRRASGPLEDLHRLGHLTAMGVLWRTSVCYIYHRSPGGSAVDALGSTHYSAATHSGIGLALLSTMTHKQVRELYRDADLPDFHNTTALLAELKQVGEQGYAAKRFDTHGRRTTIAVPVGQPAYAAIGLSGELDGRQLSTLATALRQAAKEIEG